VSLDPPRPILATWIPFPPKVVVTFNMWLAPGPLDPSIWSIRYGGNSYPVAAATALTNEVTLAYGAGPPDPGPDVVNWLPPPYDVRSLARGTPATAILDFPLT